MSQLSEQTWRLRRHVHHLADLADDLGPMNWSAAVTLLREIANASTRVARMASDLATEITNAAEENGIPPYLGGED